mmetsp:Transcript_25624/g.64310  ORF Transcript_25624/g.64310 Transcript_25624/m.64310 type:complete len:330 (+) Transcript_25624:480-1469(+)
MGEVFQFLISQRSSGSRLISQTEKDFILCNLPTWERVEALHATPGEWERLKVPIGMRNRLINHLQVRAAGAPGNADLKHSLQGMGEANWKNSDRGTTVPSWVFANDGDPAPASSASAGPPGDAMVADCPPKLCDAEAACLHHWDHDTRVNEMKKKRTQAKSDPRYQTVMKIRFHTDLWGKDYLVWTMVERPDLDAREVGLLIGTRQEEMANMFEGKGINGIPLDFWTFFPPESKPYMPPHLIAEAFYHRFKEGMHEKAEYYLDLECGMRQWVGREKDESPKVVKPPPTVQPKQVEPKSSMVTSKPNDLLKRKNTLERIRSKEKLGISQI